MRDRDDQDVDQGPEPAEPGVADDDAVNDTEERYGEDESPT